LEQVSSLLSNLEISSGNQTADSTSEIEREFSDDERRVLEIYVQEVGEIFSNTLKIIAERPIPPVPSDREGMENYRKLIIEDRTINRRLGVLTKQFYEFMQEKAAMSFDAQRETIKSIAIEMQNLLQGISNSEITSQS